MAESIGGIFVTISVDMADFQSQLNQATQVASQAGATIGTAFGTSASAGLGQVQQAAEEATVSLTDLRNAGLALSAISAGIIAAGTEALEAAGKFEQWQVSFTRLLGSEQAAKDKLEELVNFAQRTPFDIPDVVANAQKLMGFGFAASQVIPILTNLGDAVSGLGKGAASLNSLTLAFGEMEAKGVVQLRQLNMLTTQGIPAIEMLAKAYDVSTTEITAAITKKLVPASEAIPVLLEGINAKFGGMMEAQSQTFLGMLSNLRDATLKTFAAIGDTILPFAKEVETDLFGVLSSLQGLAQGFAALPRPVQEAALALAAVAAAAGPLVLGLTGLAFAITSIGTAAPVLIPLAGIIGGIAAGIALLKFDGVIDEALKFFETLHDGFGGLKDLLADTGGSFTTFSGVVRGVLNEMIPGFDLMEAAVRRWAKAFQDGQLIIKGVIDSLFPGLAALREGFVALAAATEFLSGHYKSMDDAAKAVTLSLTSQLAANVPLVKSTEDLTTHLTLATAAVKEHDVAHKHLAEGLKSYGPAYEGISKALVGMSDGYRTVEVNGVRVLQELDDATRKAYASLQLMYEAHAKGEASTKEVTAAETKLMDALRASDESLKSFHTTVVNGVTVIGAYTDALKKGAQAAQDFSDGQSHSILTLNSTTTGLEHATVALEHATTATDALTSSQGKLAEAIAEAGQAASFWGKGAFGSQGGGTGLGIEAGGTFTQKGSLNVGGVTAPGAAPKAGDIQSMSTQGGGSAMGFPLVINTYTQAQLDAAAAIQRLTDQVRSSGVAENDLYSVMKNLEKQANSTHTSLSDVVAAFLKTEQSSTKAATSLVDLSKAADQVNAAAVAAAFDQERAAVAALQAALDQSQASYETTLQQYIDGTATIDDLNGKTDLLQTAQLRLVEAQSRLTGNLQIAGQNTNTLTTAVSNLGSTSQGAATSLTAAFSQVGTAINVTNAATASATGALLAQFATVQKITAILGGGTTLPTVPSSGGSSSPGTLPAMAIIGSAIGGNSSPTPVVNVNMSGSVFLSPTVANQIASTVITNIRNNVRLSTGIGG